MPIVWCVPEKQSLMLPAKAVLQVPPILRIPAKNLQALLYLKYLITKNSRFLKAL